jgi:SAM-dependent methyltransferase
MTYSEEADFQEKESIVNAIYSCLGDKVETLKCAKALEIGGSGGILAGLISSQVSHVISTDIDDISVKYDGQFPHLLKAKFQRNGRSVDLGKLEFLWADAQTLPFRDGLFQFVFSLNAFEHIPDPLAALSEAIRVTSPGGLIYIRFDPVWTADSGSHFLHRIGAPWEHLLSSDAEVTTMMAANGASDDEIESYKNHMNRLPAVFYRDNFPSVIYRSGATILYHDSYAGCVDASHMKHPNLAAAASHLNCEKFELLIRGFEFLIQRN